ncbi:NCA2-domain-containing protein [Dentipellis sp. KUC8613]|nr:NCA2-domain-containing protein [Dentipellis sp. KUC8613]
MSASVSHLTNDLILLSVPSEIQSTSDLSTLESTRSSEQLRSLYLSLRPPLSHSRVEDAIQLLEQYETQQAQVGVYAADEEKTLKNAIAGRLIAGLYAEALDVFLKEASEAEIEADWWADIERSPWKVTYFLLQSLPSRVVNLVHNILHALRSQNRAFQPSVLTITSLRDLLNEKDAGRPSGFAASLFPHLYAHHRTVPLSLSSFKLWAFSLQPPSIPSSTTEVISGIRRFRHSLLDFYYSILAAVALPIELTRRECAIKREELQRIRDERAETLGELMHKREQLAQTLQIRAAPDQAQLTILQDLDRIIGDNTGDVTLMGPPPTLYSTLSSISSILLPRHVAEHKEYMHSRSLHRPSRLTLLWPRLVLLPPLGLFAARQIYASQDTLIATAHDAWETIKGFWRGWLVEPLKDILKTVRAGGEQSVIVSQQSVEADMQSLERMAVDLARDKLHYGPAELEALSAKIRVGDLTPILEIYEEDIKSPVKSAVSGTLLRSVFVQVQKAKVDINQALDGIDKLLKSQELTFAFVGVAPALAIVYVAGGYARNVWSGGRGRGRYGGKTRRAAVWQAMRRIERLLISQPRTHNHHGHRLGQNVKDKHAIPPLTTGLLLLSVSALRNYGERHLPQRSRIREGFLEDVGDLENPALDRDEKMKVVERMWRSWGDVLEWRGVARADW